MPPARNSERRKTPHVGGQSRSLPAKLHAGLGRGTRGHNDLQQAGHGNAPGKGQCRHALIGAARGDKDEQHGNEHHIQKRRREGRDRKAAKRVEDAAIKRNERHEDEKGKRDAGKQNRKCEFLRIAREARRKKKHQPRHGDFREHGEGDQQNGKRRQSLACKCTRGFRVVVKALGEERNERGVEGAFGKEPADHIGDAERNEEGIGH